MSTFAPQSLDSVAIVGVGLIGGSIAAAIKSAGWRVRSSALAARANA